jgi:hypothetical protein
MSFEGSPERYHADSIYDLSDFSCRPGVKPAVTWDTRILAATASMASFRGLAICALALALFGGSAMADDPPPDDYTALIATQPHNFTCSDDYPSLLLYLSYLTNPTIGGGAVPQYGCFSPFLALCVSHGRVSRLLLLRCIDVHALVRSCEEPDATNMSDPNNIVGNCDPAQAPAAPQGMRHIMRAMTACVQIAGANPFGSITNLCLAARWLVCQVQTRHASCFGLNWVRRATARTRPSGFLSMSPRVLTALSSL